MKTSVLCLLAAAALTSSAFAKPSTRVERAGWTGDGAYLVTSLGRNLTVLDGRDGHLVKTAPVPGDSVVYISFSPDSGHEEENWLSGLAVSGQYALTGGGDKMLYWWKIPELEVINGIETSYGLTGLSLGGQGLVGGYTDSSTRYLDSDMRVVRLQGEEVTSNMLPDLVPPYSSETFGVPQISPGGEWAVGRVDDKTRLWHLSPQDITSEEIPEVTVEEIELGTSYFYRSTGSVVQRYSYAAPTVVERAFAVADAIEVAVDGEEQRLVVRTADAIWLLDQTGQEAPQEWKQTCQAMTLCPDGKKVLLWHEKRVEAWDLDTRQKLFEAPRGTAD